MDVNRATEIAYENGMSAAFDQLCTSTKMQNDGRGAVSMNGFIYTCKICEDHVFIRSGEQYKFCPMCGRFIDK